MIEHAPDRLPAAPWELRLPGNIPKMRIVRARPNLAIGTILRHRAGYLGVQIQPRAIAGRLGSSSWLSFTSSASRARTFGITGAGEK